MMLDLKAFKKPALQFSGGKDSLACWFLLREWLDDLQVYWLDTGDGCPETLEVVEWVRKRTPNFIKVKSDVTAWREAYGFPSDLLPSACHPIGHAYGLSDLRVSGRFDCCFNNIVSPMHERMLADGVDAVIRGTKLADTGKVPAQGLTPFYTILLPIVDWSHEQVFKFLESVDAPSNPIYDSFRSISAPECFNCTAWWGDGKAEYFRTRHPGQYEIYVTRVRAILHAVNAHLNDLQGEFA